MPADPGAPRRRHRPHRRVRAVLALAAAGVVGSATGASAHTTLESTTPRAGAVVQAPLRTVQLTFDEAVGSPAFVAVTGPRGRVDTGAAQVRGAVVSVAIADTAPAGRYTVAFRVVSDDGHPVEASYSFQLAAAVPTPPPASAPAAAPGPTASSGAFSSSGTVTSSSEQGHSNHWFMGLAGIAMVFAGAGALVWERRHRDPTAAGTDDDLPDADDLDADPDDDPDDDHQHAHRVDDRGRSGGRTT